MGKTGARAAAANGYNRPRADLRVKRKFGRNQKRFQDSRFCFPAKRSEWVKKMAMAMVHVKFDNSVPSPQGLVSEAERLGGLPIHIVEEGPHGIRVSFVSFPDGIVSISRPNGSRIIIADYSCVAHALYRLLWQTANHLGGDHAPEREGLLPLPLTAEYIREYDRKYRALGWAMSLVILVVLTIVAALFCGGIWMVWHYVV